MKREDLRKIEGITDAIVDAVMKLHQTDAFKKLSYLNDNEKDNKILGKL